MIKELDVVEMLEDLPDYGIKSGERGTVILTYDCVYDLEFVDESGRSRFANGVKPEQLKVLQF
jgi:hypothetical protein